jgi:regulator of sirC expression with transglutaminase-like and TPR domain
MTKEEARAKFAEMVARNESDLELDRAALLIAAEEYPRLDVQKYLDQIGSFAELARSRDDLYADPRSRIVRLGDLLFGELGFRGNVENYFDARNSFLNDVIDRRAGIPITLSVLYIEIARRIGLKVFGVGLPGHFIVKFADDEHEILIDPFNGGRLLTEEKCREMIEEIYRGEMGFHPAFLYAVTKKQILARMLQNLKGIYARACDHHKTLGAIERALLIHSEMGAGAANEIRDRGLVYSGMGRYVTALADLEEYLRLAPLAPDKEEIEERIRQLRHKQARLN